jgi:UDP-N-acetylmuramyl pentapeptide phosphotransferase/UDP-N-acetylglucosamine-1-phosphate transferase
MADDISRVRVGVRLIAQLLAAGVLVFLVGSVDRIVLPGVTTPIRVDLNAITGILLTVAAIVGFTNAFNFMDGIDGIAAAQALIGATLIAAVQRDAGGALVAAAIAGAAGGFLVHNYPPARVFMGDTGSQYLGFLFGALALVGDRVSTIPATLIGLAFLPFAVDAGATVIARFARGARLHEAHRDHAYQRLILAGWSHARTSVVYAGLALAAAIGVFVVIQSGTHGWFWWALAAPTFILVGSRLIRA